MIIKLYRYLIQNVPNLNSQITAKAQTNENSFTKNDVILSLRLRLDTLTVNEFGFSIPITRI